MINVMDWLVGDGLFFILTFAIRLLVSVVGREPKGKI